MLEYLSPRDGSPFPVDEHANDVVHRHILLLTSNAAAAAKQFSSAHATFVSPGVVSASDGQLGFRKAFLVRDPDGHAIFVEER